MLGAEKTLFAFQSAKDEFVFTNEALILVKGESAASTRRTAERLEYRDHFLTNVQFETTGRLDRDCEIKFLIGDREVSIDIARKEEKTVKVYYKALVALEREQQNRQHAWKGATDRLADASNTLSLNRLPPSNQANLLVTTTTASPETVTQQANRVLEWMKVDYERLNARCYQVILSRALDSSS
ncbi:hypothetical protein Poli38472_011891 [Pythium oligandrum]|uniref:Bacterial Pleckstrin homology domain-containing protein n=1 Tax=Pythium oligandrum TaxID=41045 RepID=A0A8K1FH12_PYTOL|nr:hypothetical protein Poli38472_011891 [Pythium oligandrum]|eukprot:TMW58303.1 hypothetical protein Poli38472_011891 [Pythium oligandrum]